MNIKEITAAFKAERRGISFAFLAERTETSADSPYRIKPRIGLNRRRRFDLTKRWFASSAARAAKATISARITVISNKPTRLLKTFRN